jgi:hypothetical protein
MNTDEIPKTEARSPKSDSTAFLKGFVWLKVEGYRLQVIRYRSGQPAPFNLQPLRACGCRASA